MNMFYTPVAGPPPVQSAAAGGLGPALEVWSNWVIRNNIVDRLPKSTVAVFIRVNRFAFAHCMGYLYNKADNLAGLQSKLRAVRNHGRSISYAFAVRHIDSLLFHEQGLGQISLSYPNLNSFTTSRADHYICGTRELDEWLKSITPDMTLPVKLTVQRVDSEVWPSLKLVLAKLPRSFGHWGEYNLIELFNPGDDLDRASSSEAIRWLGEFAGQANRITLHVWTFRVDEMAAMALAVEDGHWITLDYSPWVSRDIEVGAWRMSDATERQCKGAKLTLRLTLALSPLAFAMDTLCNSPERRDWIHDLALSLIRAGFVPLNCSLEFNLEDCELADEDEERLLDEDQQRIEADKELFTILLCDIMTVLERTLYPPRCNPSVKSWRRLDPSERVKVNKQEGSMGDGAGMTGEKELGSVVEGTAKHGQVAVGGPENAAGTQHAGGTEGRANKE